MQVEALSKDTQPQAVGNLEVAEFFTFFGRSF